MNQTFQLHCEVHGTIYFAAWHAMPADPPTRCYMVVVREGNVLDYCNEPLGVRTAN